MHPIADVMETLLGVLYHMLVFEPTMAGASAELKTKGEVLFSRLFAFYFPKEDFEFFDGQARSFP